METCANHPGKKALSVCHGCGRSYCESCLVEGNEYYYCKNPECQRQMKEDALGGELPPRIQCPACSSELQLSEEERKSRKFHCSDCEAFVDFTVSPPRVLESKRYSKLFATRNVGDIALLKSYLDDSEIDYYVAGDYFMATYPMVEPARFYVLDEQMERARGILKEFYSKGSVPDRNTDQPD